MAVSCQGSLDCDTFAAGNERPNFRNSKSSQLSQLSRQVHEGIRMENMSYTVKYNTPLLLTIGSHIPSGKLSSCKHY